MHYIQSIPNWQSLTAEEALDYLRGSDLQRKNILQNEDPASVNPQSAGVGILGTTSRIQRAFPMLGGMSAGIIGEGIYQFLLANGMTGHALAYSSSASGLDFGDPAVQETLDTFEFGEQLPQQLHEPIRQCLKNFGVDARSRWQKLGLDEEPTLEQVSNDLAIAKFLADKTTEYNEAQARVAVAIDNGATFAEVQTAWEGE